MRGNPHAERAVKRRPDSGLLDEGGKADATIDALVPHLGLLATQRIVIHERQQPVVTAVERQFAEHRTPATLRAFVCPGSA